MLRALDHLQDAEAIGLLRKKRKADGWWLLQNRHSGETHFEMEKPGSPSRWNTLRALRVLRWWEAGRGV